MEPLTKSEIPPEFAHLAKRESIPWNYIIRESKKRSTKTMYFKKFTDTVIELALKECERENPDPAIITLGMEACLNRGRFADALFISSGANYIEVLSMRAIVLSVISDAKGLRDVYEIMERSINDKSSPSDQIRLSTVKVMLAAAERDTSVIFCFMEFDNLLDTYPEQVETPLTETMFTLYVVGNLLNVVGQMHRAERIADALGDMAKTKKHRLFMALVENLKGTTCGLLGKFAQAEEHFNKLQKLSEELSFKLGLAVAMNNLGKMKLNYIELEEAFNYFLKAYDLMDMEAHKVYCLTNLGEISALLGHSESALEYLDQAVQLDSKVGIGLVEAYALKAIIHSRIGDLATAWGILRVAMHIAESSEKPKDKVAVFHAHGILKAEEGDIDLANETMRKALSIANEKELFEWLVRVELDIVRINIEKYIETSNKNQLQVAEYHLSDLIQIANEQEFQALYAECLVLRSEIRLCRAKLLEAKGDLERAAGLARLLDNQGMIKEINQRLDTLEFARSEDISLEPDIVAKILDRASAFKPAIYPREIPQPKIHAIIAINRNSGLPEYVYYFDERISVDSSIISGFISAITSFSSEMLGESGFLRSISHEGFTLMLEYTDIRIVILVASRETFDIRFKLHKFARKFESMFPSGVEVIKPAVYSKAENLINDIFLKAEEPKEISF